MRTGRSPRARPRHGSRLETCNRRKPCRAEFLLLLLLEPDYPRRQPGTAARGCEIYTFRIQLDRHAAHVNAAGFIEHDAPPKGGNTLSGKVSGEYSPGNGESTCSRGFPGIPESAGELGSRGDQSLVVNCAIFNRVVAGQCGKMLSRVRVLEKYQCTNGCCVDVSCEVQSCVGG